MQATLLSPRQNEILNLVVQGHTNKMIARELWLSEKTAKNQLTILFRKLNVQSRTQAAVWAMKHSSRNSDCQNDREAERSLT